MNIKEIAEQVAKTGGVAEPKVTKVEAQVRTGVMFPLPDWIDAPAETPGTQSDKRQS